MLLRRGRRRRRGLLTWMSPHLHHTKIRLNRPHQHQIHSSHPLYKQVHLPYTQPKEPPPTPPHTPALKHGQRRLTAIPSPTPAPPPVSTRTATGRTGFPSPLPCTKAIQGHRQLASTRHELHPQLRGNHLPPRQHPQ